MIKKKIIPLALTALALTSFQACNSGGGKDTAVSETQQKDTALFSPTAALHKPIRETDAAECIEYYLKTRATENLKAPQYISFAQDTLTKWINKMQKVAIYDTLRVSMGRYTDSAEHRYGNGRAIKGKVSMFLIPYKGNQWARYKKGYKSDYNPGHPLDEEPVDAYNLGDIHP